MTENSLIADMIFIPALSPAALHVQEALRLAINQPHAQEGHLHRQVHALQEAAVPLGIPSREESAYPPPSALPVLLTHPRVNVSETAISARLVHSIPVLIITELRCARRVYAGILPKLKIKKQQKLTAICSKTMAPKMLMGIA